MNHQIYFFTVWAVFLLIGCGSEVQKDRLSKILSGGDAAFQQVLENKEKHEIQILFSPVTRIGDSIAIVDHFYNYRPDEYFYPASTVKMPVAILAMQLLREIQTAGLQIDQDTPMGTENLLSEDTDQQGGERGAAMSTIGEDINMIFAISDNAAYNRLYEFTTQDYINRELRGMGIFTNSRIVHRVGVSNYSYEDNKQTQPIHFYDENGEVMHTRPATYAQSQWILPISDTQKGKAYIDDDAVVEAPFDFSKKNFINIRDLQESLKRLVYSQLYPVSQRYGLSDEDRSYLLSSMGRLARDYPSLAGDSTYYDGYVKFFMYGDTKDQIPDHITIRNKVGHAYGYLTDCAYIEDKHKDIAFFLTATILVNENQTFNDGVYEYDEIGIPFLAQLGRLVYEDMVEKSGDLK